MCRGGGTVDATDSKSVSFIGMRVRFSPAVPFKIHPTEPLVSSTQNKVSAGCILNVCKEKRIELLEGSETCRFPWRRAGDSIFLDVAVENRGFSKSER